MSAIICFDIRNFTMHTSHHSKENKGRIFKVISDIFKCLDKAINDSRKRIGIKGQTFVNHTGDGFVAIFYGQGKSLQSLLVASLVASDVENIIKEYNINIEDDINLRYLPPLGYGIGIHWGSVNHFNYHHKYPGKSQMTGFLGHVINISNRVQESTKDHTFKIICTEYVHKYAMSGLNNIHGATIEKYFTKLDKHNFRGANKPITLYGVQIDFAKKFESHMLNSFNDKEQQTGNR